MDLELDLFPRAPSFLPVASSDSPPRLGGVVHCFTKDAIVPFEIFFDFKVPVSCVYNVRILFWSDS